MKVRKVTSGKEPTEREYLQGKLLINIGKKSKETEYGTEWTYYQVKIAKDSSDKMLAKAIKHATESMKKMVTAEYEKQANLVAKGYSQWERDSFATQEAEANAYKADNTAEVPMITAIANARGIEIDALADKILVKSALFKQVIGSIMGAKQKELG